MPLPFAMTAAEAYPLELYAPPVELPGPQACYLTWKNARSADPGHVWLRETLLRFHAQAEARIDRGRIR